MYVVSFRIKSETLKETMLTCCNFYYLF